MIVHLVCTTYLATAAASTQLAGAERDVPFGDKVP